MGIQSQFIAKTTSVDNTTIELNGDGQIRIKDNSITQSKIGIGYIYSDNNSNILYSDDTPVYTTTTYASGKTFVTNKSYLIDKSIFNNTAIRIYWEDYTPTGTPDFISKIRVLKNGVQIIGELTGAEGVLNTRAYDVIVSDGDLIEVQQSVTRETSPNSTSYVRNFRILGTLEGLSVTNPFN